MNDESQTQYPVHAPTTVIFGLSGALGACTSGVLLYPLDTVRTRLQLQCGSTAPKRYKGLLSTFQIMMKEERIAAFYRGLPVHVTALASWAFVYFGAYNTLKLSMPFLAPDHPVQQAIAAGGSWVASVVLTNPLWIIKTRAQAQTSPFPITQAAREFAGLRRSGKMMVGAQAAMWGALSVMFQLPQYEYLKTLLLEKGIFVQQSGTDRDRRVHHFKNSDHDGHISNVNMDDTRRNFGKHVNSNTRLTPLGYLICTSVSMLTSSLLTYPQDVIRARLQGTSRYCGALDCVRTTIREESIRGLYSGMGAHLVRLLPTSAITFIVYEWTYEWFTGQTMHSLRMVN